MITEITIKNMKGQTIKQPLTGKNIIIGKNGVGKTTRIQALGLAMLGYVPGQKETAAETFKFATGTEMTVGLKTGDFEFSRSFVKEEKTNNKTGKKTISIKEKLSVSPGKGERTATQKKDRIQQEVGNFPVALDFNKFLALSDAKRRDFIYSLSPIKSNTWDKEKLAKYLQEKMLTPELQENNEEQYKITKDLIAEVLKQYKDTLSIHDGLLSMIDWATTELSFWKRKQTDSQGAVRQMADMKNQLLETDRNIADTKKELEELQQNLIEIEKKIASDTEKKRIIDNRLQRIEEVKKEIQHINETEVNTDTASLDKEIASLTTSIPLSLDVQGKLDPINKEISELNQQIEDQRRVLNEHKSQIMNVQANVQTLDNALRKVGEMAGFCVISQMISCPKDFTGFDKYVDDKKAQANKVLEKLQQDHAQAEDALSKLQAQLSNKEKEKAEVFAEAQKVQSKREELSNKIKAKEAEKQRILSLVDRRENKLSALKEELDKLVNEKPEPIGDISIMEKQVAGIRARITELKAQVEEKEKSKQTLILMNESILQNNEAEYKAGALKILQECLGAKGVQGEIVKEILEPIRAQIEENLKLMNFNQVPYFQTESDTGKELFEFGWINEKGHEVNFNALSTGQQTVYLAAMIMTIIDQAQPKLRILAMDNLNHLDKKNFQLLVNGLNGLAHKVDNIILAGALEYDFEAEGWQIDNLAGQEVLHDDSKIA